MNEPIRVRGNQQRELAAHVVNGHCNICLTELLERITLLRLLPVPEFDACVPPARNHD